jgi:hypothetical protein
MNFVSCIYEIFESIFFFRMTGRFNGPFVEILVSAIIGARSWLLGTYVRRGGGGSGGQHGALKGAERGSSFG